VADFGIRSAGPLGSATSVVVSSWCYWKICQVMGSSCHYGMVHPQLADRGDGPQMWRVAVNILNKPSWTVDRGWSSSLGVGWGLTTPPHHKTSNLLGTRPQCLGPERIIWHDPSTKKWI
jgi:hypothetical protein